MNDRQRIDLLLHMLLELANAVVAVRGMAMAIKNGDAAEETRTFDVSVQFINDLLSDVSKMRADNAEK